MTTQFQFHQNDLIVTRIYNAAIEEVFDAWVQTSKIKQWWGCAECIDVQSEVEPRVGGQYSHHMTLQTPQGTHTVPGVATLIEFDPPKRLAYTSPDDADPMVVTVDFVEVQGGTQVRLVHSNIPDMTVDGDVELKQIIQDGWSAATEKLDRFLNAQ